jgi:hypothetical protein
MLATQPIKPPTIRRIIKFTTALLTRMETND